MSYVELHAHSAYSFLDGASSPVELAAAAAARDYPALALTDHDGLWGAMEFAHACKGLGVKPITGAELTVAVDAGDASAAREDGSVQAAPARAGWRGHLTLLAASHAGYRNLCRLITEAHAHTRDGREPAPAAVSLEAIERHAAGLFCLSGCARQGVLAGPIERGRFGEAGWLAERLGAAFGRERFLIELQRPFWRNDRARNRRLAGLAEHLGLRCVATGDVHAHESARARLQDAFVAVRQHGTLDQTEPERRGNASSAMASPDEMAARFRDYPEAVGESARLAGAIDFDLTADLGYRYPGWDDPQAGRKLAALCRGRLEERYPAAAGRGRAQRASERRRERREAERRLAEELQIIAKLGLAGFFLLHHDLLELARMVAREVRGADAARQLLPPGRGRGSSVSSIVCYLTGLSHVDPVRNELFLGRFLNDEITALPDIDLDFPRDIREELIRRAHERYGSERAALVAAFPTYRRRGAIRDLGKALGLPPAEIERAARLGGAADPDDLRKQLAAALGRPRAESVRWQALVELIQEARGLPRHVSQHPGGMVISTEPLADLCPLQPAAMEGRYLVQWDKDSCADAGFLKIDLLGLGMLSAVERCVTEVARVRGERIDLSRIPLDDAKVYGAIQSAETTGVFQIESRAQMQMLKRSRPATIDDLTVQVAIVRPGPIQGGAVHPYLEHRKRLREDPDFEVPYEHPSLEPVLRDTLGAIVFQDQVLEVAIALAGFSVGEAEGLRRAMSRKRSEAAIRVYRERFVEGAVARGVGRAVAERVFAQVQGFSGFGFPKSHAAAFGLLAYQSTWLRVYYGPELLCALLNEQPMGFYPPDALVHEAQRRGIDVLPPDVNESDTECAVVERGKAAAPEQGRPASHTDSTGERLAVRIGLGYVLGVRADEIEALVAERKRNGRYRDVADLAARCGASRETLERLAWAGTCDGIGRREALWQLGTAPPGQPVPGGLQLALPIGVPESPALRALSSWERLLADYESTRLSLAEHPLALLRPQLPEQAVASRDLENLRHGQSVTVAGLVVARQRPQTAWGVTFILLEDECGTINLIVPPPIHERHRPIVRGEPFVLAIGRLERRDGVTNVLVSRLQGVAEPDRPGAQVEHLPRRGGDAQGREQVAAGGQQRLGQRELADLRAAAPAAHSFGRRG